MVSNTPFGMYSYGVYGLNNSYNPQFTGAHSQPVHESGNENSGEAEKEPGSKAFITNGGHGKSAGSGNSDLALSVGIGACVAALGVIFTRHLLKPSDISKFLEKSKNLTGKVTEEVKTIVPEIEKTISKVEEIAKEAVEKTVPKIEETVKDIVEKTVPKVETGTLKTGEELIEKKVISPENEIVSSKFPKVKTLQESFKDTYEKGESVLNKVPYAKGEKVDDSGIVEKSMQQAYKTEKEFVSSKFSKVKTLKDSFADTYEKGESVLNRVPYAVDIKKETTIKNKKGFITKIKDTFTNLFSKLGKNIKSKKSVNTKISEIENTKSPYPSVEEIFEQQKISSNSKFADYDKASKELADKNLVPKALNNLGSSFKINKDMEDIIAEKVPNYIEYLNQLRNNQQPIEEINKFIIELEKGKWGNFPKDADYKSYYLDAIKSLRK